MIRPLTTRGALAVAIVGLITLRASADIVWTFETDPPTNAGPIAADVGIGTASAFHVSSSSHYTNTPGNGSPHAYTANDWHVGDYNLFTISTIGLQNIKLSWDQVSNISGPAYFDLRYSTDGQNFTTALSYNPAEITWSASKRQATSFNVDLTSVNDINNAASVYFQFIDTSLGGEGGQVLPSGTSSFDNVTVTGSASVPEPSSLLLVGLAGLGGYWWRRRQARCTVCDGVRAC